MITLPIFYKEMESTPNPLPGSEAELEIMLVDNDPITCLLNRIQLESFFSRPVRIFYNAVFALEYIWKQLQDDRPLLVLMEIFIPEEEGWEFLDLCQTRPMNGLRIVIVTHSVSSKVRQKALTYPQVVDFYEKPLMKEDLYKLSSLI